MRPTKPRKIRRRRRGVSPFFLTIVAAAVFSAVVAGIWQVASPPIEDPDEVYSPSEQGQDDTSSKTQNESDSQAASQSSSGASNEEEDGAKPSSEVAVSGEVEFGKPVPEQANRVTSTYFDDAVFVGDSITTGIPLYGVMDNAEVFASVGVSLDTISTKACIDYEGETLTITQALERANPGKIYVMLGANGIAGAGKEHTIELYSQFMDTLKEQHPNSIIYIQSVLPIDEAKFKANYGWDITNKDIEELNTALMEAAGERGLYYLDVAEAFRDENGAMPSDFTPDGIHINSPQYITWFDYLKTHAIS